MTGQEVTKPLLDQPAMQNFLRRDDIQKALDAGDFEQIYSIAAKEEFIFVGQMHWLFEEAGINPLDYMTNYLPERYFYVDVGLSSYKVQGQFKTIGKLCFAESKVKEVELEEGVETLQEAVFKGCDWLKRVILPASLKTPLVGETFRLCDRLKEIEYRGDVMTALNVVFTRWDVFEDSVIEKVRCQDGDIQVEGGIITKII